MTGDTLFIITFGVGALFCMGLGFLLTYAIVGATEFQGQNRKR